MYSLFSGRDICTSGVFTLRGTNSGFPSKSTMSSLARLRNSGLSPLRTDSSIMPSDAKYPGSSRSKSSLKLAGSPLCGVAVRNSKWCDMLESVSPRRYRRVLVVDLPEE